MTGHAGLPAATAELVTAGLHDHLRAYTPGLVGVTMLGPGADQLFARVVLELGGTLHVVVPAAQYRDSFEDPDAQRGYDELYAQDFAGNPFQFGQPYASKQEDSATFGKIICRDIDADAVNAFNQPGNAFLGVLSNSTIDTVR